MDIATGAAIAAASASAGAVAKEALKTGLPGRLLGPMIDGLAEPWGAEIRRRNMEAIAKKLERRAKEKLAGPQVVNARVAYRILHDGSLVNDDVMQEYVVGLLEASLTTESNDDRASYYVDLVARLPAAQVRLHHAIYAALATAGPSEHYGEGTFLDIHTIFAPVQAGAAVLQCPADVTPENALGEALTGLDREGLISSFAVAQGNRFQQGDPEDVAWYMKATPTVLGCMLALWAHGIRDADVSRIPETAKCNFDSPGPTFESWRFPHGSGQVVGLAKPML